MVVYKSKYYRKIHMWGLRGKARKCPFGTVYVCPKKKQCRKDNCV